MSPFEYVIVLISIILGLGITTILTGVAELIKQSRLFHLYAPYIIWIMLVFVMHIHEWWVSYDLKTVEVWTLHMFLFILLYPINLYVLAHLLFPAGFSTEFTSREFYLTHYPRLFIATIILAVLSIVHNLAFLRLPIGDQIPQALVLGVLSTMVILKTKNGVAHTVVAVLLLAIMIISLLIQSKTLY
jgi:hypothetical protein